jgi:DNA repair exonuclease SbcCD ATPase subunit
MSEDVRESIKELEVTLSRLSREVSETRGQIDDVDTSYIVGEIKDALDSIESDIDSVNNALEEVRDNVQEPDEYSDVLLAQKRLGRNASDVINLLGIATERIAMLQRDTYDDSAFALSNTNSDTVNTQASALFNFYWLLVDVIGYSNEDFKNKLMNKQLDYTFKDKEVPTNA